MTGGDALVATLVAHGVEQAFGVPGESYLAVLEALRRSHQRIRFTVTRHESGATFAADAYGRLARRPAAVFVTRGPGATNAAIGIHTAQQDSTPVVLFVGDVPRVVRGREAFQEVDYQRMYAPLAKAVLEPPSAREVAEVTAHALRLARTGRPGPVVVVLPEDVTEAETEDVPPGPVGDAPAAAPAPEAVARATELVRAARQPVVIAGELVGHQRGTDSLATFAEVSGAGVVTAFRRQDAFPNDHPAYLGHLGIGRSPALREVWRETDVVIAAGTRLDDITTEEFTLLRMDQRLIHIHPDAAILARTPSDVALAADLPASLGAITTGLRGKLPESRLAWRHRAHAQFLADATPGRVPARGDVDLSRVVAAVQAQVRPDTVIVNDAGNFAGWVHRYYRFTEAGTQAAPVSGAMGYGVPGALGARLAKPDTPVVAFVGDGGFLMTGQELVTAVEQALPIRVIVVDNAAYGTILMHQHRRVGPEAPYGVRLRSPDFAAVARGYGAAAFFVGRTGEFPEAFAAALAVEGPALVHVRTDVRDISAGGPLESGSPAP